MRRYSPETDRRSVRDGHYSRMEAMKDQARRYAEHCGHSAGAGGYIKTCTGFVICQGWSEYYRLLEAPIMRYNGGMR